MRKPCCDKKETDKGASSLLEDQKLTGYILKHGEGCWCSLPQDAGLLRSSKSCRLRWFNYLRPNLKGGNFGEDEEDLLIKLHALLGNSYRIYVLYDITRDLSRWSLIAGRLPGRTDIEVKNYWNIHLKRKLLLMGIDPDNRRSFLPPVITRPNVSHQHLNPNPTAPSEVIATSLPDLNLDLTIAPPVADEKLALI